MDLCGQHVILRPRRVEDAVLTLACRLSSQAALLKRAAVSGAEEAERICSRPTTELNFVIQLCLRQSVGMLCNELKRRAEPARFLIGEPDAVKGPPVNVGMVEEEHQTIVLSRMNALIGTTNGGPSARHRGSHDHQ